MKTYTENELKKWFEVMKKRYPNSPTQCHLEQVELMMFDKTFPFIAKDNLDTLKSADALN